MTTYREKLLDPRWQKKRLQILERDGWKCRICDDDSTTLHVHHLKYRDKAEPWDYPACALMTLCSNCHCEEHSEVNEANDLLLHALRTRGATSSDMQSLVWAFLDNKNPHGEQRQIAWEEWVDLGRLISDFLKGSGK